MAIAVRTAIAFVWLGLAAAAYAGQVRVRTDAAIVPGIVLTQSAHRPPGS